MQTITEKVKEDKAMAKNVDVVKVKDKNVKEENDKHNLVFNGIDNKFIEQLKQGYKLSS